MVRTGPPEDEEEDEETGGREPATRSCPCCEGELVLARLGGVTLLRSGNGTWKERQVVSE